MDGISANSNQNLKYIEEIFSEKDSDIAVASCKEQDGSSDEKNRDAKQKRFLNNCSTSKQKL
jgi:hypothetical protein